MSIATITSGQCGDTLVAPGTVYGLAVMVAAAMAADTAAQSRYLAIYGTPWVGCTEVRNVSTAAQLHTATFAF